MAKEPKAAGKNATTGESTGEVAVSGGGSGGGGGGGPGPSLRYALKGLQVEPTASLWLDNVTHIRVPPLTAIMALSERTPIGTTDRLALDFTNDFPFDPDSANPDTGKLDRQLQTLIAMAEDRPNAPYPAGETFGPTPDSEVVVTPLSRFIHLQPIPFGTIMDIGERTQTKIFNVLEQHLRIIPGLPSEICKEVDGGPPPTSAVPRVVNEPRELARIFENETPGHYHRHALNWLFYNRPDVSPPRQARVWMALDVTIYAALCAAWHYKWLRDKYSRLLRPDEYDSTRGNRLRVLFDRNVDECGQDHPGPDRACPTPSPGTPRHPAWPSGHSTFSAAASHILEYFFSPETLETPDAVLFAEFPPSSVAIGNSRWLAAELRRLANNIGEARMWAGVHWRDDHVAGQKIGRAAAQAVIEQLKVDCVPDFMLKPCNSTDMPPNNAKIATDAGRGGSCAAELRDKIDLREPRGADFLRMFGTF